jgi:hypothetical protein
MAERERKITMTYEKKDRKRGIKRMTRPLYCVG